MDKKASFIKKPYPSASDPSEYDTTTYKNENVVFKIHSAKGQQNYNSKTFPAKFSINISNEHSELGTGAYNREPSQPPSSANNNSKNEYESTKGERMPASFDLDEYDRQIKAVLEDKKKCDRLIGELEETCEQYEHQNEELKNCLSLANQKNQEYSQKLQIKDKSQAQLKDALLKLKMQNKDLEQKVRRLQEQNKRYRDSSAKQDGWQQQIHQLHNKIAELEQVIGEKEQMIKNISNFNNEIARKILDEQLYSSSSHVKQMEKWLKIMSKKYQAHGKATTPAQQSAPVKDSNYVDQLLKNSEKMAHKINELEKAVYYLDCELKKASKQNQNCISVNQDLRNTIMHLQGLCQQRQSNRETQQSFYRRSMSSSLGQQDGGTIIYQGTVKVKMQSLLLEKDKRINSLEQELMEAKRQNTLLRTKLYQLDCEQTYIRAAIDNEHENSLKRARSLGSFRWLNEQNRAMRSQYSQGYQTSSCTQKPGMDQIRELLQLQKATYNMLEGNIKKQTISFDPVKWNQSRWENEDRSGKENINMYTNLPSPATERLTKYDYAVRRADRSQRSCYFSQDY